MKRDAFGARNRIPTRDGEVVVYRLDALARAGLARGLDRLPFSIRCCSRPCCATCDGELVTEEDVRRLAAWNAAAPAERRAALHARRA